MVERRFLGELITLENRLSRGYGDEQAIVIRATQADLGARSYRLRVTETTLWANWFFIGSDYSSYTLLRNRTASASTATITWHSDAGVIVGAQTVSIPAGGVIYRDARTTTTGALAGSVQIGYDGEPEALVGSQTTLSGATGLSFDTLFFQRASW